MSKYLIAAMAVLSATTATAGEFTGPWVDARGGWDSVQLEISDNTNSFSSSKSGFLYGAAAGYDFALGTSVIAGASAGIYGSTAKFCSEVYGNDEACIKAGRDFELLARLGFKVSPTMLVYGLVGYANGQISVDYTDDFFPAESYSESGTKGGVRFGVGGEFAFSPNFFAKAEYRYTSYGKDQVDVGVDAGFNRNQVLVGAGYRF